MLEEHVESWEADEPGRGKCYGRDFCILPRRFAGRPGLAGGGDRRVEPGRGERRGFQFSILPEKVMLKLRNCSATRRTGASCTATRCS